VINSVNTIRKDYTDFLNEYGFTQEFVDVILKLDTMDDKDPTSLVVIKDSVIEGVGMFAVRDITKGELIARARVNGVRVLAGRYTNHSPTPNAIFVLEESMDLSMVASQDITSGEEVTINYRQAGEVNGTKT
jgi:SET domain-containing protein